MSDAHGLQPPQVSPLRQIDVLADRFEQEWKLGNPPPIASLLEQVPPESAAKLLAELVCIDLEYRLRNNRPMTLEDYFREFPDLERLAAPERAKLELHAWRCQSANQLTVDHTSSPTDTDRSIPGSIGRYRVAGQLASGGQADVYLSFHPDFKIPVAIKWWNPGQKAADPARQELLLREGHVLASLQPHPNLVRVFALEIHEGRPFLVLELVQGLTLDQYSRGERFPPRQAARLVAAVADAVQVAHEHNAIHQDIKPQNILIDARGEPRLVDFGLAWFRSPWADPAGEMRPAGGTPRFFAPEQADSEIGPVGPRTDVFGLGAVFYFLLTGQPLYEGATLPAVLSQAASAAYDATALDRKGIPKRLAAVCRKALAWKPQERYATAGELAVSLRAAAREPRWRKVAGLVALLLAAVACGWQLGKPARQKPVHVIQAGQTFLNVRVGRLKTGYMDLREALPVKTGDDLQVRIYAPAGLHLSLCYVNGQGRLSLLRQYSPQDMAAELVFPGPEEAITLAAPDGTELLFVCGRADAAPSEAELRTAWDSNIAWPALSPSGRLLRLRPDQVQEERSRDLVNPHRRPEDPVVQRLNQLRERLRLQWPVLDGVAFLHVKAIDP